MGNTDSAVASGVKKQAGPANTTGVYKFINVKGEGELVTLMKDAAKTKDYSLVEECIRERVVHQLYNKGEGRLVSINHLVLLRNRDRPKSKLLEENRKVMDENGEFPKLELEPEDPSLNRNNYDKTKYRFCCYDLDYTGAVQEGILLLSMLNSTSTHRELVHHLLRIFPRLINDVYLNEEYYGESALHIAIVNEDPAMVKLLLDYGIDVHERCFGNFMSPEDQKSSRYDLLGEEVVQVGTNTNYEGYIYWGEYALSFAACLAQEECYRLILSRGADPDKQDSNGNTTSHMMVIYSNTNMFNVVFECGANIDLVNRRGLTPLTLAAKLAKKDIYAHILQVKREIYWQIGNITCSAYPLTGLDSFDTTTGQIDNKSSLNLIVFGEKLNHLDMLDGVVVDLLNAKWNAYVRKKFKRMMTLFTLYFILNLGCFVLRPSPCNPSTIILHPTTSVGTQTTMMNLTKQMVNDSILSQGTSVKTDLTTMDVSSSVDSGTSSASSVTSPSSPISLTSEGAYEVTDPTTNPSSPLEFSGTSPSSTSAAENSSSNTGSQKTEDPCSCALWQYHSVWDAIRWGLELAALVGTVAYVVEALKEARFLGFSMFLENLTTVPSRVLFLISCLVKCLMLPLRLGCLQSAEDVLAVMAILGTAPYYLFFCRGYKSVGPFVTMIYTMIVGDLLRFVTIYMVFVMGFSQAYFNIYRSYDNPGGDPNPMETPMQSILLMFVASMTNFGDLYNNLKYTKQLLVGQILFILYMVSAAILLINMLIAMMGNTYQRIAEMKNEWMRQWARIVLVVERGVSPQYRLEFLKLYSKPMTDGTPALILRTQQSDEEMETMRDTTEMKIRHHRNIQKRLSREQQQPQHASTRNSNVPH